MLGLPRSTLYRQKKPRVYLQRPAPVWTLCPAERQAALDHLHQPRFMDLSVQEIYATLLDEGIYLCSLRTLQRLLAAQGELRERRAITRHPTYKKPELLARRPNEVWSWDITKVRGPQKGTWYQLYVVLDIFSRRVVGWLLSTVESEDLAADLVEDTCNKYQIPRRQLTLHADRGPAMRSRTLAERLADLGVEKSHSRPYVSNDNPYSESQFKTMKYRPGYPDRFGGLEDGRRWFREFFYWYNLEHHHIGLALLTPEQVHTGEAEAVLQERQATLDRAFAAHPERFSRRPLVPRPPTEVWIGRPAEESKKLEIPASLARPPAPAPEPCKSTKAGESQTPFKSLPEGAEGVAIS